MTGMERSGAGIRDAELPRGSSMPGDECKWAVVASVVCKASYQDEYSSYPVRDEDLASQNSRIVGRW